MGLPAADAAAAKEQLAQLEAARKGAKERMSALLEIATTSSRVAKAAEANQARRDRKRCGLFCCIGSRCCRAPSGSHCELIGLRHRIAGNAGRVSLTVTTCIRQSCTPWTVPWPPPFPADEMLMDFDLSEEQQCVGITIIR